LNETLSPYAFGEKELPVKTKRVEQGGADQPATALESKSEGKEKPKQESEGRPQ